MLDSRVGAGGRRAGSDRCRGLSAEPDQPGTTTENRRQVNPNCLHPRGEWFSLWLTTWGGPFMLAPGFQVAVGDRAARASHRFSLRVLFFQKVSL